MAQENFGWVKKILGLRKSWVEKKIIGPKENVGSKKYWVKKLFFYYHLYFKVF